MTNCIVIQKSQNGKPYFMILTAENIMPVPLFSFYSVSSIQVDRENKL